ncbi:MAG: hypothetical protein L0Y37_02180 [Bacteroidales bacterium]|nr:hypothetical protein [Bacteroidales bacterium]
MRKSLLLLLVSLLAAGRMTAQYYETGQDPASLRWDQIRTEHFRIIYPRDFNEMARRYAVLLEESFSRVSNLYPEVKVNIPVIMHNHSMESNGYVIWAPRRMELYPLPGQTNLPSDPAGLLAMHEAVHVAQLASLNKGVTRFLSLLLGEQIIGANALMIPSWAFEGDAVYAETLFTPAGRGRSNVFLQRARALTLSQQGIYGYDKLLSGSYRDFTPDHYVFGYLMMNSMRQQSENAWSDAMDGAARMKIFNPVNRSLKKNIGLTKKSLYDSTFSSVAEMWSRADIALPSKEYPIISREGRKDYVSHYLPHRIDEKSILSLKTSLSHPQCLVITNTSGGTEHVLTTTGYIYPYIFSFSNGTAVWSELHTDPRWENREYSVIKKMDISGGAITQLTFKSRCEAPDLSPDGTMIAAVATEPDLSYSLIFIDAFTGETKMNVATPGNIIIQRPSWTSDGQGVTVVTLTSEGEGIRTYYPTGKRWVVNRPESDDDIIQAEFAGDTLLWLAQGDGSDNIYRTTPDGITTRVTGSRFGISGFSVSGDEILVSDYTVNGFGIARVNRVSTEESCRINETPVLPETTGISSEAEELSAMTEIPDPVPYRKMAHLFNFHSWFPFYADIDELQADPTAISPGLTLMSQNHLSTLITSVGYEYSDNSHHIHSNIAWRGWYPVVEGDLSYGGDPIIIKTSDVTAEPADMSPAMNLNVNVNLPLYFAYGKFRQTFMPAIYLNYRNSYTYITEYNAFDEDIIKLTGRLYFANTFRYAYRDIYPKWGQVIDLRLVTAPWDKELYNSMKYARGTLFLPGIVRNHSLVVRAGYETQAPARKLLYYNSNPYPRGYHNYISETLFSISFDYTMPLFYPDLGAGSLFYIKRIRGSLFFDGATGTDVREYSDDNYFYEAKDFGSFGGELLADFYILRFPFEINAGVSGGYIPVENRTFVQAVFSVNIYGTTLGRDR